MSFFPNAREKDFVVVFRVDDSETGEPKGVAVYNDKDGRQVIDDVEPAILQDMESHVNSGEVKMHEAVLYRKGHR